MNCNVNALLKPYHGLVVIKYSISAHKQYFTTKICSHNVSLPNQTDKILVKTKYPTEYNNRLL